MSPRPALRKGKTPLRAKKTSKPAKSVVKKLTPPTFSDLVGAIRHVDESQLEPIKQRLDSLTKPQGSLGQLEWLAAQLALIRGNLQPSLQSPAMLIFAADHGAADAGLSAYPSAVTRQMLGNFLGGGAAINVLARQFDLQLTVIDAGVRPAAPVPAATAAVRSRNKKPAASSNATLLGPQFLDRSIAGGTQSYLEQPAMSHVQAELALARGADVAAAAIDAGADAIGLGEMGIGNTASSSLLMHCLTGRALVDCIGRGTGLDAAGLERKRRLLATAAARGGAPANPISALVEYGGFETAMLAGAIIACAARRVPAIIDGFTVTTAALIAGRIAPASLDYCVFSHRSAEHGHRLLLEHLGAEPLLDLGLRLGEGSGAALAMNLCRAAAALMNNMASFTDAGVSGPAT